MKSFDIFDNCTMVQLSDDVYKHCEDFSCGDVDLDDFFINDAQKYADEMIYSDSSLGVKPLRQILVLLLLISLINIVSI